VVDVKNASGWMRALKAPQRGHDLTKEEGGWVGCLTGIGGQKGGDHEEIAAGLSIFPRNEERVRKSLAAQRKGIDFAKNSVAVRGQGVSAKRGGKNVATLLARSKGRGST